MDFESTAFDHSAISPWYKGEDSIDFHILQVTKFMEQVIWQFAFRGY